MDDDVNTILEWMGIENEDDRVVVADEAGLLDLSSFVNLDQKGVVALVESLRKRQPADQRVHISKGVQDMMVNTANWVEDFSRVSLEPEIPVDEDEDQSQELFEAALLLAKSRAEARKYQADNTSTLSDAAKPTPLKEEKKWYEFTDQLFNYLSVIPGVKGVPLAYVIRENDDPQHEVDWEDDEFNAQMIACAPLNGAAFATDAQTVHMLLRTLIESEELASVIETLKRRKDGRRDFVALKTYMEGSANVSRRVGTAKKIKENLHYRNERALKFSMFITKLRHMHRIFNEEDRPMSEKEKVEDLLEKIKAPFLSSMVANLKTEYHRGRLDFDEACNVLAAEVATAPEAKLSARISQLESERSPKRTVLLRNKDGSINVEYEYPPADYTNLANKDKNALRIARSKAGRTRKGPKNGGKDKNGNKTVTISEVKEIIDDAMKRKAGDGDDAEEEVSDSHGNSFGGRREKKQKT